MAISHRTCPSRGSVRSGQHAHAPAVTGAAAGPLLQRELRVKLTHHTKSARGSVVSLTFIFTNPPEYKKKEKINQHVKKRGIFTGKRVFEIPLVGSGRVASGRVTLTRPDPRGLGRFMNNLQQNPRHEKTLRKPAHSTSGRNGHQQSRKK